jgi:hypothetical protein
LQRISAIWPYGDAVAEFMAWCEDNQVPSITAVQPLHVGARIDETVQNLGVR